MSKTEYVAFRATPTEKLALEQLAERTEGNKSVVLRELLVEAAIARGLLPADVKRKAGVITGEVLGEQKGTPQRESRGAVEVGNER